MGHKLLYFAVLDRKDVELERIVHKRRKPDQRRLIRQSGFLSLSRRERQALADA